MEDNNIYQPVLFQFTPQTDISFGEVISILSKMNIRCTQDVLGRMPSDLSRHFTEIPTQVIEEVK